MDATPNLDLPFIAAAQAQKHVTHNETLRALDALVQLMVLDKDLGAPPGAPADGARYIVASTPTGAWAGHANDIAAWQDGAWVFYAPREGWLAWTADEDALYVWSGAAWTAFPGASALDNVVEDTSPQLGGDLDANGFDIGFDDGTGITDDAGNEQVVFHKTASAVNQIGVTNAATGGPPRIAAEGADTNIDLEVAAKGSGAVRVPNPVVIANGASSVIPLSISGGGATNSARIMVQSTSDATNPVMIYQDSSPGQARNSGINFMNSAGTTVGQIAYQFNATGTSQWFRVYVISAERMRWDGFGNCLLGGTQSPASAQKALVIFNGVAPTGGVTDGVVLFAEDVAASSELRVRDEAGNVTTLSPHNFSGIPEGPSEPMAWAYHSQRGRKAISVDMLRALRVLEKLSGEKLVYEQSMEGAK
jgi:hypothetical protein